MGESREERNARLEAELERIAARIAEIRRILRQDPGEGERPEACREERGRKLRVVGGGAPGASRSLAS